MISSNTRQRLFVGQRQNQELNYQLRIIEFAHLFSIPFLFLFLSDLNRQQTLLSLSLFVKLTFLSYPKSSSFYLLFLFLSASVSSLKHLSLSLPPFLFSEVLRGRETSKNYQVLCAFSGNLPISWITKLARKCQESSRCATRVSGLNSIQKLLKIRQMFHVTFCCWVWIASQLDWDWDEKVAFWGVMQKTHRSS